MSTGVNNSRGIVDVPSNRSVNETVERLKGILAEKSVALFALVATVAKRRRWG